MPGVIGPLLALGMWQAGDMNFFTVAMLAIAIFTGVVGYSAKWTKKKMSLFRVRRGRAQSVSFSVMGEAVFADLSSYSCAIFGVSMILFAYERRKIFVGSS
jgi:hypothetical protein